MNTATQPTTSEISDLFAQNGPIGMHLKGFEVRTEQQSMACDIWQAFSENSTALIEAGTGTGKSLAYLIPAILWAIRNNEQIVISTNTIALQEQLIQKDIPMAIKVLGCEISVVRAIGAQNYLCQQRLEDAIDSRSLYENQDDAELFEINSFSRYTVSGTKSDLSFLPSQSVWSKVNVDLHSCSNKKCEHFSKCFFFKAKKEASEATLLIVNHHLLFSDLSLRMRTNNYTDTAVLPAYKRIIFDEAHHLEEVAAHHFAIKISRLEFLKIHADFQLLVPRFLEDMEELSLLRRNFQTAIAHFFDHVGTFLQEVKTSNSERTVRILEKHREHPLWKSVLTARQEALFTSGSTLVASLQKIEERIKGEENDALKLALTSVKTRTSNAISNLRSFFSPPTVDKVYWIETDGKNENSEIQLVSCSFDVARLLKEHLFDKTSSCIFSSATLSSNNSFSYIKARLGIPNDPIEKIYQSPFDYQSKVLFGVPTDLPLPEDPSFQEKSQNAIKECLIASGGSAFVLFTSYDALKKASEVLFDSLKEHGLNPMKQGDDHRHTLIKRFKQQPRSVLFATDSFWEGVDIVGDALHLVIIHKLPFHVPTDPMSAARCEHLESLGKSPFFDYSLPKASVKLKQAFGRLIRHKEDRGVCICLDVRLIKKGYGKILQNSLPKCLEAFKPLQEVKNQMIAFYKKRE